MSNVNKVIYGDKVLIDLTKDTVTPETLASGVTAHSSNGKLIVGLLNVVEVDSQVTETSENPVQSKAVYQEVSASKDAIQSIWDSI